MPTRGLFNNLPPGHIPAFKAHYGNPAAARNTIRRLRSKPCGTQRQVAARMISRATYHAHQTANMRAAAQLYKKLIKSTAKRCKTAASRSKP
jgi:hypothetical protein